ncbi:uncharacterized protein LOC115762275 [Drosophila novamexicana]|uniref:uncharacterized protein LOC115762275 n=1 Tax=Drosophila novamexicana TaxID=47314 RepID=UPI0011E5C233|nr:uncharacterized protein LOC115762275 [Drosophila novamexicana]
MIYYLLQAVSTAIFSTVATIWLIEETLINLMMASFLFVLRIACHPLMLVPMLAGSYYVVRKVWLRRRQTVDGDTVPGLRSLSRTPRIGSYRSMGSLSARSNDSCDYDDEEVRRLQCS